MARFPEPYLRYADELLGVLVLKYGLAKLSAHAVIVNASDKVLLAIARD